MKKFMIIDGSSLLYRAFYAITSLKNANGTPTNAIYGFLTMFLKAYEEMQPDYVAVAFDKGRETFRMDIYPEYKATRESAPEDLKPQFALIKEVLSVLGITTIEMDQFEGDDIIGSLSKKWGSKDLMVEIVTGDRDILQLVDNNTDVFITKKGISEMLQVTMANMEELIGYTPDKVIEMKGLMGDKSDNIPGIFGVGEKTALKFINKYGNIEGLYEAVDELKGKMKEKIVNGKESAFISRELATIKTDIPMEDELNNYLMSVNVQEMKKLFTALGLHRLVERCMKLQKDMFLEDSLFSSFEKTEHAKIKLTEGNPTEEFYKNKDISVMFTVKNEVPDLKIDRVYIYNGEEAMVINSFENSGFDMKKLIEDAAHVITIDSKNLLHAIAENDFKEIALYDCENNPKVIDLTLMAYILDPTRTNYGLTYLSERFGLEAIFATDLESELLQGTSLLLKAMPEAIKELEAAELIELYNDMEYPLVKTLCVMENNGIYIDREELNKLKVKLQDKINILKEEIYLLAGENFNINSPKQLGVILFEKLELPVIKKTKTGYSTNADVLDELMDKHPIIKLVLEYRGIAKLLSTYVDGLVPLIHKDTDRIHTTFNQEVTATGRLSSSNPNLQNIPVRTEQGKEIRSLFKPGKEYDYLVSADYSQIELRVLAHLSEDESLINAFKNGEDIHRHTAAEVLNKQSSEITPEERSKAKAVNFGIIYGISDYGLARDLGITRNEAKEYIEAYFEKYPTIKGFMDEMIAEAKATGSSKTMFGRVRSLPDINNKNFNRRSFAERTAMNTPIQGTAADIIKFAMNKVEKRLENENVKSRLLLQVHDELVLEVIESEKEIIEKILREEMESVVRLSVPLVVDVHSAKNWALVK